MLLLLLLQRRLLATLDRKAPLEFPQTLGWRRLKCSNSRKKEPLLMQASRVFYAKKCHFPAGLIKHVPFGGGFCMIDRGGGGGARNENGAGTWIFLSKPHPQAIAFWEVFAKPRIPL